ncbi:hypothetical protein DPMN_069401 [Dreissena polymorpha]|uniref:Uncharacterized protein n=1 Tax=Dreissena polymorpha TaxID=45954 RepID=A0A9D3YZ12_DREPO|nr:hypothetical protein DPMN_069401 [Dreissena polymorpha]
MEDVSNALRHAPRVKLVTPGSTAQMNAPKDVITTNVNNQAEFVLTGAKTDFMEIDVNIRVRAHVLLVRHGNNVIRVVVVPTDPCVTNNVLTHATTVSSGINAFRVRRVFIISIINVDVRTVFARPSNVSLAIILRIIQMVLHAARAWATVNIQFVRRPQSAHTDVKMDILGRDVGYHVPK